MDTVNAIGLILAARKQFPGISTPGRPKDKEYQLISYEEVKRLHPKFKRWARWHNIEHYVENSNDCDDYAAEFIRYLRRTFKDSGRALAVCLLSSADHAVVGLFLENDLLLAIEPTTCDILPDFKAIELEML